MPKKGSTLIRPRAEAFKKQLRLASCLFQVESNIIREHLENDAHELARTVP